VGNAIGNAQTLLANFAQSRTILYQFFLISAGVKPIRIISHAFPGSVKRRAILYALAVFTKLAQRTVLINFLLVCA